jgi:hypothetical protein
MPCIAAARSGWRICLASASGTSWGPVAARAAVALALDAIAPPEYFAS